MDTADELLEERFANALHGTARSWRQAVDRRLKYLGVSQASWMTIAVAAKAGRPLSQSELADRLAVEGATMVAMVDRLVNAGLVLREPSTTDRRIKRVVITDAGYRLFDKVKAEAAAVRKELLAKIDPRHLETATQVLETLQEMIEAAP
ncbi:MAG TPA: MarR family transcriptional regulator [Steroidobacteraceae bacterium]|jgi:MarR family transcriptional regulator for hemolysin|nr:MarR family transcriptional regulator [Steroidobacteraceae bacterium]